MLRLRSLLIVSSLAFAHAALADASFFFSNSDTRTLLQDQTGTNSSAGEYWDSSLFVNNADNSSTYLNGINVTTGAGFDPNIGYTSPTTSIVYNDFNDNFAERTYTFGTAIPNGSSWDLRRLLDLGSGPTTAAIGVYDFSVDLVGGSDANATDLLGHFDLHVEVADRIDVTVMGSTTDIDASNPVSHASASVTNNMSRDFVTTTWYYAFPQYTTDPSTSEHTLDGTFVGDWFNKSVAPGDTLTGAHTDWSLNGTSVVGVYKGHYGLYGGLHNGDEYGFDVNPDINVRAVPEPSTVATVGLGALALLRRRRRRA